MERHTTDTFLKFIEDRPGLVEKVDLVAGGMMQVMRDQEETQAKKDWEAAKEAGVDMGKEGVRWDREVWPGDMGIAVPSTFISLSDLTPVKNGLQTMYNSQVDRKSTRLNSSHSRRSRMPSSA